MKHLRITVEGRTYEVEVEVVGQAEQPPAARGGFVAQPVRAAAVNRTLAAQPVAAAPVAVAPAAAPAGGTMAVVGEGAVASPLSALVVSVDVAVGQKVAEGDRLVTLEAMKMNTIVSAPRAGIVTALHVASSDAVQEGDPLVTLG